MGSMSSIFSVVIYTTSTSSASNFAAFVLASEMIVDIIIFFILYLSLYCCCDWRSGVGSKIKFKCLLLIDVRYVVLSRLGGYYTLYFTLL